VIQLSSTGTILIHINKNTLFRVYNTNHKQYLLIFKVNKMMNRNIVIIIAAVIFVLIVVFFVPLIDEFETFNCITTPCIMPKITIHQWLHNQYSVI